MKAKDLKKLIIDTAENSNFQCTIKSIKSKDTDNKYTITFQGYTDFGQDLYISFDVEYLTDIVAELYDFYENFDVDEEAYLWIGPDGHPKNGAPSSISALIDDMREAEKMYETLGSNLEKEIRKHADEIGYEIHYYF